MRKTSRSMTVQLPEDEIQFHLIDQYALDKEWVNHIKMVRVYGEKLAKARYQYELIKTACQVFEAETSRRIRQKPKRYAVGRLTEGAIKEVVSIELLASTEHGNLLKAKYKVEILEIAVRTLEHRKRALSDLVYLHGAQYFAQPKIPKNLSESQRSKMKDNQIRGMRDEVENDD